MTVEPRPHLPLFVGFHILFCDLYLTSQGARVIVCYQNAPVRKGALKKHAPERFAEVGGGGRRGE